MTKQQNKTLIQWIGLFLTIAGILVGAGAFKNEVNGMQTNFKDHCKDQQTRDSKVNDVLSNLAISTEKLNVHIENLTKNIDELKTELKRK